MVQAREKYEHIGEEIKMMDLLADVCLCALYKSLRVCVLSFVCVCVFGLCRLFGFYIWCIVFVHMRVIF